MEEIYLAYARDNLSRAKEVADGLVAEGFSVFFDPAIPIGSDWEDVLEAKHAAAKAVVVLWSEAASASAWVRSEARRAIDDGKIAPAKIEVMRLRMRYDCVQTADLAAWRPGDFEHHEWRRLVENISERAGRPVPRKLLQTASAKRQQASKTTLAQTMPSYSAANGSSLDDLRTASMALCALEPADIASYRHSASKGETWAQYMLGVMHMLGYGGKLDTPTAIEMLAKAAKGGWTSAWHALGVLYEHGVGVKKNLRRAAANYRRSARKDYVPSINALSNIEERSRAA